eukprot:1715556-Pyramimonas_sp.AAC.1
MGRASLPVSDLPSLPIVAQCAVHRQGGSDGPRHVHHHGGAWEDAATPPAGAARGGRCRGSRSSIGTS